MDAVTLFEDMPLSRAEVFFKICGELKEKSNEELEEIYANILERVDEDTRKTILDNEINIACAFEALYDNIKNTHDYEEQVLDPSTKAFNEVTAPIHIAGFELDDKPTKTMIYNQVLRNSTLI